jgi:hypothetical protein
MSVCVCVCVCVCERERERERERFESNRLCVLVARVPGYRSRGLGTIPGVTKFLEVVGVERGPVSLVRITEKLFQGNSGCGLENRN